VTGGAGYIGSHATWQLIDAGYSVVVLDNLYSGHRWAVHPRAAFEEGNAGDIELVRQLLRRFSIDAVLHFAGHIVVPESVSDPLKYYQNNTAVSRNLIAACAEEGIGNFIFSSTAAVYGTPQTIPVTEQTPTIPINPYGRSKLMTEWMLRDLAQSELSGATGKRFRYIALRYFNAAGARLDGALGQATPEATHLIKVACEAACGRRERLSIFGTDYDTPDGTCVRDYIHVEDLAAAHVAALQYLEQAEQSQVFNCGYGRGFSVREVLAMVRDVSGQDFAITEALRRAGDPPALISDSSLLRRVLHWQPKYEDLRTICESAYRWERGLQEKNTWRKERKQH
ncbi:MAG TPA: UDP-glucose 4-epimerase GalE, partial [Burkholderiales bacterium]|nr:UDP-glucose 4-epimerase GalE [Burkholderiales bacterium]